MFFPVSFVQHSQLFFFFFLYDQSQFFNYINKYNLKIDKFSIILFLHDDLNISS